MSGKSPVSASEEQRSALMALAGSRDRGEADRARAILLTLSGWTSPRIAEAYSVREDTVRLWRSDFSRGGIDAFEGERRTGSATREERNGLARGHTVTGRAGRQPAQLDDCPPACRDRGA